MDGSTAINVQVRAPVAVPPDKRREFENAAISFLLGHDRIRPELVQALEKRGLNVLELARLSAPEKLGVCPTPGAREFIPDGSLVELCAERGVSLVEGGRVSFQFVYEKPRAGGANELEIAIEAPANLGKLSAEQTGAAVRALFGDCALPARAQDYLRAFGVDIVRFAGENEGLLGVGRPMTSRASPEVEAMLEKLGLKTDRFGQLKVVSPATLMEDDTPTVPVWSKTTCC